MLENQLAALDAGEGAFADPLPQALALTAIVITFGVTAFLLALGFRSWQLTSDDRVEDDVEDRLVARRAAEGAEAEPVDPEAAVASDFEPGTVGADAPRKPMASKLLMSELSWFE